MKPTGCLWLSLLWLLVRSSSIQQRQASITQVIGYIESVTTAIYVVDNIKDAAASCLDGTLVSRLNEQGYDGQYARQLLCEVASGFDIFTNIDHASRELNIALAGLTDALSHSNDSARVQACRTLDIDTLDNAALDGDGIQSLICATAVLTSLTPSPTTANHGPTSSSLTSSSSEPSISTSEITPVVGSSSIASSIVLESTASRDSITLAVSSTACTTPSPAQAHLSTESRASSPLSHPDLPKTLNYTATSPTGDPTNSVFQTTSMNSAAPIAPTSSLASETNMEELPTPIAQETIVVTITSIIEVPTTVTISLPAATSREAHRPWRRPHRPARPLPHRNKYHRWPTQSVTSLINTAVSPSTLVPGNECAAITSENLEASVTTS